MTESALESECEEHTAWPLEHTLQHLYDVDDPCFGFAKSVLQKLRRLTLLHMRKSATRHNVEQLNEVAWSVGQGVPAQVLHSLLQPDNPSTFCSATPDGGCVPVWQRNGWDCGVFLLCTADHLSRGACLSFTQADMPELRLLIALEISKLRLEPLHG